MMTELGLYPSLNVSGYGSIFVYMYCVWVGTEHSPTLLLVNRLTPGPLGAP